jgi:hypothetical protein
MKPTRLLALGWLLIMPLFFSCKGKRESKTSPVNTASTVAATDNVAVPVIDIADLKDETTILDAMEKVVDARLADEKKRKESDEYAGNYLELTRLYTNVLNAAMNYSKTIKDPAAAVAFNNKVSSIQDKMYAK